MAVNATNASRPMTEETLVAYFSQEKVFTLADLKHIQVYFDAHGSLPEKLSHATVFLTTGILKPTQEIQYRVGIQYKPAMKATGHYNNILALLMMAAKLRQERVGSLACETCKHGFGKFAVCVQIVDPQDVLFAKGSCASCLVNNSANACSLSSGKVKSRAPKASPRQPFMNPGPPISPANAFLMKPDWSLPGRISLSWPIALKPSKGDLVKWATNLSGQAMQVLANLASNGEEEVPRVLLKYPVTPAKRRTFRGNVSDTQGPFPALAHTQPPNQQGEVLELTQMDGQRSRLTKKRPLVISDDETSISSSGESSIEGAGPAKAVQEWRAQQAAESSTAMFAAAVMEVMEKAKKSRRKERKSMHENADGMSLFDGSAQFDAQS